MLRNLLGELSRQLFGSGRRRRSRGGRAGAVLAGRAAPAARMGLQSEGSDTPDASDALRRAFTPTRPLRSARRLAGRRLQFARVLRALLEEAAHVVIYAERGRGKTSLANLVAEALRSHGVMVARYTCSAEDDFDAIARGLMRDLPRSLMAVPAREGDHRLAGCEAALPAGRLQPRDVLGLTGRLTGFNLVLMVDEFDRVSDGPTRTRLADTVKVLSDRAAPILFVVVGVSENLEELLGRHPSIQRNVVGVPLPLLTDREVNWLLEQGGRDAGLAFPTEVREVIVRLARGVPYIAQLLALHAGHAALTRGTREISLTDLLEAVRIAVAEADPRVAGLYETLTDRGRDVTMASFLRAMAGGAQDAFGRFAAELVGDSRAGVRVAGRAVSAKVWQRLLDSGAVRPRGNGQSPLFGMAEATFGNYVLMRAACDAADAATEPQRPAAG